MKPRYFVMESDVIRVFEQEDKNTIYFFMNGAPPWTALSDFPLEHIELIRDKKEITKRRFEACLAYERVI